MASLAANDPPVCTYSAFYSDEANDTFNGDYRRVMGEYTLEGNGALSAADINFMVNGCAAQRIPTAFLMLGTRVGTQIPTVQLFHRVTHFQSRMGMPPSTWDNSTFAFAGDVFNGQISTVSWDSRLYEPVYNNFLDVGTVALIDDAFAVDPNVQMVGPFAIGDAGTERVRVRRSVYVPPMFVSLLLDEEMTPRDAW